MQNFQISSKKVKFQTFQDHHHVELTKFIKNHELQTFLGP